METKSILNLIQTNRAVIKNQIKSLGQVSSPSTRGQAPGDPPNCAADLLAETMADDFLKVGATLRALAQAEVETRTLATKADGVAGEIIDVVPKEVET